MLRVTTIHASSAGASARYYTRYLADDVPDADGHWVGRQADGLGLVGVVGTDDLEAVLEGRDPANGTRLGTALVDRVDAKGRLIPAVAGFDATFSAPKSVSLWWGLTGDPGVSDAHQVAVRAALDHLERYGATTRIRVNGARQHPDAQGLTMAVFPQATSREDDPQLHSHVVISTKVRAPDGRWFALDARYLKRHQRMLGGLYQSVLRAELTHRYGIAWGPIANGQAEIAGVPRDVLEAFSKRTAQVDAALTAKVEVFKEREGRDPTRWERAALTREAAADSRAAKTGAAPAGLHDRWHSEAAELGWTPKRLVRAMRDAGRAALGERVTVEQVLDRLSTAGSTWSRADVLQAVCDVAPPVSEQAGHQWAAQLEAACDRVTEHCVALDPPTRDGPVRSSDGRSVWTAPTEPHLSHEAILAQEERILLFSMGSHEHRPAPSPTLERDGLDVLQADAAAAVAGHDRLVLVVGPAGTGKTTALARAVDDLHHQGRPVFGVAPSAKAARVLGEETGMAADTVAKLLHEWRAGPPADPHYRLAAGTTVIVDEAGMLGTGNLDELIAIAESHRWRLALVGDPRQLQAVGRGGMFDELCRAGRTHHLATTHRFHHHWEQAATLQLRNGQPGALDAYLDHDRVTAGTFDALLTDAAERWLAHHAEGRTVTVTAETNVHVDALNAAIQQRRRTAGDVDPHTAARVAQGETVSVGDLVVTRRNDRSLTTNLGDPVRNRERWRVTAVHDEGALTVTRFGGRDHVTLPGDYASANVRLGYAATAHGHQGDTADASLTIVTPATSLRTLYVGATRGRRANQLLVVTDTICEFTEARDVLERVLTNDRADIPAVVQRQRLVLDAQPSQRHEDKSPAAGADGAPAPQADLANVASARDRLTAAERRLAAARVALGDARRRAQPALDARQAAESTLRIAEADHDRCADELRRSRPWQRRRITAARDAAAEAVDTARTKLQARFEEARPWADDLTLHLRDVDVAEREVSDARMRGRLERRAARRIDAPTMAIDRGASIDGIGW